VFHGGFKPKSSLQGSQNWSAYYRGRIKPFQEQAMRDEARHSLGFQRTGRLVAFGATMLLVACSGRRIGDGTSEALEQTDGTDLPPSAGTAGTTTTSREAMPSRVSSDTESTNPANPTDSVSRPAVLLPTTEVRAVQEAAPNTSVDPLDASVPVTASTMSPEAEDNLDAGAEEDQCNGICDTGGCSVGEGTDTCSRAYEPVCGCDGETYGNECRSGQVPLAHTGRCRDSNGCDIWEAELLEPQDGATNVPVDVLVQWLWLGTFDEWRTPPDVWWDVRKNDGQRGYDDFDWTPQFVIDRGTVEPVQGALDYDTTYDITVGWYCGPNGWEIQLESLHFQFTTEVRRGSAATHRESSLQAGRDGEAPVFDAIDDEPDDDRGPC
jgi:hypothetical protein